MPSPTRRLEAYEGSESHLMPVAVAKEECATAIAPEGATGAEQASAASYSIRPEEDSGTTGSPL